MDASGNIYVIGNATGDFGNQINQGTQDVYLTKYDSAGNVRVAESAGQRAAAPIGYGLALDPSGGVVVTGASTADLTTTSVANGNNDSFVARYDANGNQTWIKQIQTLATNQSNAVSVDASGNIYIGGSVSGGVIGAGQTSAGGKATPISPSSIPRASCWRKTSSAPRGSDSVAATATGSRRQPVCRQRPERPRHPGQICRRRHHRRAGLDPGSGRSGGGRHASAASTVSGGKVYVSGTTSNANLTAGGSASIAAPASGGIDAFVFSAHRQWRQRHAPTPSPMSAPAGTDTGRRRSRSASDGTVYLTGIDHRHLRGRSSATSQNVTNAFATALNSDGTVKWTRQYGGADGSLDRRRPGDRYPMAPACWMRWACRAAPSTSTSRWI